MSTRMCMHMALHTPTRMAIYGSSDHLRSAAQAREQRARDPARGANEQHGGGLVEERRGDGRMVEDPADLGVDRCVARGVSEQERGDDER